jgi:hypothetical protein
MATTLSPTQEPLVVELRRILWLSLDDLNAIPRAYSHPAASHAAIGRLLQREGVSRLADRVPGAEGEAAPAKRCKDYALQKLLEKRPRPRFPAPPSAGNPHRV